MAAFLDVVTGYLGAGKTTFIEKYIDYLRKNGITFAVIENEFGKAGIDADILSSAGAKVLEISGGCVCCTLKVTLYRMLEDLSGKVDRIILEPSGLFCGDDLMDIVNTPEINVKPGFWLGVIDPFMTDILNTEEMEVLLSEIMYAGALYISKTDTADNEMCLRAAAQIKEMLPDPKAEIFNAPDPDFDRIIGTGYIVREHERRIFDHQSMYMSACIVPKGVYTEKELEDILREIMNGSCGNILRIKGSVLSDRGCWKINCSAGCIAIVHSTETAVPSLNIIGKNLNRKMISSVFSEK